MAWNEPPKMEFNQFNYGLDMSQQQPTHNLNINPVPPNPYPIHQMYPDIDQQQEQSQQQNQQVQPQSISIDYNHDQFQNQDYHQQQQTNQQRFNAPTVDACSSIVQSLCRHICGDTEFCRRAIESLVKKMKEKRDELDALITAVTTSGAVPTACVTIQRTLDGRLQVAGRKGFPHVIYARIWRWPDLTRNELKPIRTCQYGFHMNTDLICVNPYHYDRVVAAPGSAWDMAGMDSSAYDDSNFYDCELSPTMSNVISDYDSSPATVEQHQPITSPDRLVNLGQPPTITPTDQTQSPPLATTQLPQTHNQHQQQQQQSHQHQHQHQQQQQPMIMASIPMNGENLNPNMTTLLPSAATNNNTQLQASATSRYLCQIPPPEFWCTISYFELDQQVGESFRVPWQLPSVTVDGYTHPSTTDRFCLGFLNNNHRSSDVQKARLHIGRGVKLDQEDGNVYLENLSEQAVFLNSPFLDYENKRLIGNAVHKIYPRRRLKVFDLRQIHVMLSERAESARQAAAAQAAAVAGTPICSIANMPNSDQLAAAAAIGVDDLRRYCVVSMSFVKGWGLDYPQRNTIKLCPCWVEITMHRALQLLDDLLRYRL